MTDPAMPEPGATEPTAAQWSARYDAGDTPWDLGRPHPELLRRLDDDPGLGGSVGRALVPGCGRGHDARALADAGWEVVAVDMAPSLAPIAGAALAEAGGTFVVADLFDRDALGAALDGRLVDLVFDHTLFCALPLRLRPAFGAVCRDVLAPTGRVTSIVFPIGRDHADGGPPWGMAPDDLDDALGPAFVRIETSEPIEVPRRGWPHRWCTWRRTGA